MAETLTILSTACYIAAGVFLATAVFLFVAFKIPAVISDLSGRTARKSVAKIRANNERSGKKFHRSSATNAERGKVTEQTVRPQRSPAGEKANSDPNQMPETGLIGQNRAEAVPEQATTVLTSEATTVLDTNETEQLTAPPAAAKRRSPVQLHLLEEVLLVDTDEVIE